MKRLTQIGLFAMTLATGWVLGTGHQVWRVGGDAATYHTGPTIEQVQSLSCLVTARVDVADVLETRLDGYTGGMKVALLVKGDLLLGVDLSRARLESVNRSAHTATLVLPQPRTTSPRLDHERTKVFAVSQSGLWQVAPGGGQTSADLVDRGYRDAQRFVATACNDPNIIARARQQAELVLATFFRATGWKLTIQWDLPSTEPR